jgi:hypothetical protein
MVVDSNILLFTPCFVHVKMDLDVLPTQGIHMECLSFPMCLDILFIFAVNSNK